MSASTSSLISILVLSLLLVLPLLGSLILSNIHFNYDRTTNGATAELITWREKIGEVDAGGDGGRGGREVGEGVGLEEDDVEGADVEGDKVEDALAVGAGVGVGASVGAGVGTEVGDGVGPNIRTKAVVFISV